MNGTESTWKICLLLGHSRNTLHFTEHDGSAHCWTDGSLSLSWAWWTQSTPSNYFELISVLILSSCLHPRLPSGKISLGFPTKILRAFFFSPHVSHPLSISPLTWSPQQYLVRAGLFEIFYSLLCVLPLNPNIFLDNLYSNFISLFFLPITFNLCTQNCVFHVVEVLTILPEKYMLPLCRMIKKEANTEM